MSKLHNIGEHIAGTPKAGKQWKMSAPSKRKSVEVIVTICPPCPPDQRFTVKPGEAFEGGGFVSAGIGINAITGKPWS